MGRQCCERRRTTAKGVDLRHSSPGGTVSTWRLLEVPPADLDVPILRQQAPAQLPLSDALEPGPPEIVRLDAALGGGPFGKQALEYAPPDHAAA